MSEPRRYFHDHDNSGHEYAVPVGMRVEWSAWLDLDEDDEASWDVPDGVIRLDGTFTFTDPRCDA